MTCSRRQFLLAGLLCLWPGRAHGAQPVLSSDFIELNLRANGFNLRAWLRPGANEFLHVFIEGDGNIWDDVHKPSFDPTPGNSVSALLANDTPRPGHVLYLARPGQYASQVELQSLSGKWWSSHRYAPEVVQAMVQAVQGIQLRCKTSRLGLYGHSGGGALAVLAAPQLAPDLLGTVASPLDLDTWTAMFRGGNLPFSLDPKSVALKVRDIAQIHLCGGRDKVVPPPVLDAWLRQLEPLPPWVVRKLVPQAGHLGPWLSAWRLSLASALLKFQ